MLVLSDQQPQNPQIFNLVRYKTKIEKLLIHRSNTFRKKICYIAWIWKCDCTRPAWSVANQHIKQESVRISIKYTIILVIIVSPQIFKVVWQRWACCWFCLHTSVRENMTAARRHLLHVQGIESLSCFSVVKFSWLLINARKFLREEMRMQCGRYYCVLKACAWNTFWIWQLEPATHTVIVTKMEKSRK